MARGAVYLRTLAVAIAIGVLGGLLLIPVSAYGTRIGPEMPLLYAPAIGAWMLPVLTSMLTLRRPGVGVVTALVAGLVNLPVASYGFRAFVGMLIVGVFLELAVAVSLYRRWSKPTFAVALVAGTLLVGAFSALRGRAVDTTLGLALVLMAVSSLGALVLAALCARLLEDTRFTRGLQPRQRPTRSPDRLALD